MKKLSIFILEDDLLQAQQLKKLIRQLCQKHHISYDFIKTTTRSQEIIDEIPKTTNVPIYFLDIEIKTEKRHGLEVAQQIRAFDPKGIIVFITTHAEFAPISYQYMVSAFTFIDKSWNYTKRAEVIEQCLLHYQKQNAEQLPADDLILKNANTTIRVPFSEVEYIQTSEPHRLSLVTNDRLIQFYGSLKEIEALDDRLLRCHQSFVVNLMNIQSYDATKRLITFKSKKEVPVSRRLSRKVKQFVKDSISCIC